MEKSDYLIGFIAGIATLFAFIGGILFYIYIIKKGENENISQNENIIVLPQNNVVLKEIKENIETQIPYGEMVDYKINVTDSVTMLYDEQNRGLDWIGFTICNNGPNPVYFCVNEWKRPEAPLMPGDCTNISFNRKGAIKKIYFLCDSGKSSTVIVRGLK